VGEGVKGPRLFSGLSFVMAEAKASEEKVRFETELEFVQALANPEYLHHLAQNRYFDDPKFVDYLDYLQYWREMPYCQYLVFPQCLRMLELLQTDAFVAALKRVDFKDHLQSQQSWSWRQRALELVGGGGSAGAGAALTPSTGPGDGAGGVAEDADMAAADT
jgi:mediator of RNA polymerase II transcription subunit 31